MVLNLTAPGKEKAGQCAACWSDGARGSYWVNPCGRVESLPLLHFAFLSSRPSFFPVSAPLILQGIRRTVSLRG